MKRRKQSFVRIVCLTVCLLVVSACGTAGETTEQTTEQTSSEVITTEESTEETTPAPTEPLTRDPSEIKVGMIFYGEDSDGSVLSAALKSGLTEAAVNLGIKEDQILWQYNSREADWTQIEDSILACVDAECQVIFGGAREYEAVIAAIAEEYPEVMFACVGSSLMNGTNSGSYQISLAAVQYLCGAAAGSESTTGHVGFLAAKDTSDEDVTNAVNAFAYGVWSVNPQAVVEVGITGKWFLPEAERKGAADLQELGCDVIGGYTDCSAGLTAAAADGLKVVGGGVSDAGIYGEAYDAQKIGAALYQFRNYFTVKLNQVINREVTGEAWTGDYFSGEAVFECEEGKELPEEVWKQLASWGPAVEEEDVKESLPEELTETESSEDSDGEEDTEPEEVFVITVDDETGYLENVRIHEIRIEKSE